MCAGEGQVSITQPVHKVWTVNEGGKLLIVCTSPLGGSVDWLHNNVPIATSLGRNRYTVRTVAVGNMLRHYLTVKDVRQQDAGRYTCRQTYSDHRHINVSRLNGQYITTYIYTAVYKYTPSNTKPNSYQYLEICVRKCMILLCKPCLLYTSDAADE